MSRDVLLLVSPYKVDLLAIRRHGCIVETHVVLVTESHIVSFPGENEATSQD